MDTTPQTVVPNNPAELMALGSGERLQFFMSLESTSPEIATLVICTVVEDVRPMVALPYYEKLRHLVESPDPLRAYILSARYVNTARASRERLFIHQFMMGELEELLHRINYEYAYVRTSQRMSFFGPPSRRTVVLCEDNLADDDMVVYQRGDIRPKHLSINGRWPEVTALRVELDDMSLPESFGV